MNIYPRFLTPSECQVISKIIIRDEKAVLRIPNDWINDYSGLTEQHTVYNWLNHEEIKPFNIPYRLHTQLAELKDIPAISIQCWANIIRKGEDLMEHTHGTGTGKEPPFWAINIFLSGNPNTGTYFTERKEVYKNSIGELVIVDDTMLHGVYENVYDEPRISLAVDVHVDELRVQDCIRRSSEYKVHPDRFIISTKGSSHGG